MVGNHGNSALILGDHAFNVSCQLSQSLISARDFRSEKVGRIMEFLLSPTVAGRLTWR
jgi:hypothetical protein